LLDIADLLFRSNYNDDDLTKLESLIQIHHSLYINLYGPLKPKHHFLVHYVSAIRKCGPLKNIWCMRFEAKHKEGKIYFHNITSRINPPHTLALKSSFKFSKFLVDHEKSIEPVFEYKSALITDFTKEDFFSFIINKNEVDINFKECLSCNEINFKGTIYKVNYYLATELKNVKLYKVKSFIIKNENVYVLCQQIILKQFDRHFHAEVGHLLKEIEVRNILEFISPPLHLYPLNNNKTYVRIKYI